MSEGTVSETGTASFVDKERPFRAGTVINLALLLIVSLVAAAAAGCGGEVNTESVPGPDTAVGAATLAWTAPTTNADGSALTDLAGYKIYYGVVPGTYSTSIDVGGNTSYQISNLTAGRTYYFTVTAYSTSGGESDYSNEVSKSIN